MLADATRRDILGRVDVPSLEALEQLLEPVLGAWRADYNATHQVRALDRLQPIGAPSTSSP